MRTTPCDKCGLLFPMVYGSTRFNTQNANTSTPSTSQVQLHECWLRHTWMTQNSHPNQWDVPKAWQCQQSGHHSTAHKVYDSATIKTPKVTKTLSRMSHQEVFRESICTVFRKCSVCDCPIACQDCFGRQKSGRMGRSNLIAAGSQWYATEPVLCTSVWRTLSVMCTCEDFSARRRRRDSRFATTVRASRLWESCSASRSCSARSRSARSCSASRSCFVEGHDASRSCSARSRSARGCSASRSSSASRSCSVEGHDATAMSPLRRRALFSPHVLRTKTTQLEASIKDRRS